MKNGFKITLGLAAFIATSGLAFAQSQESPQGVPADALPGQCFARVLIPEVSQSLSEQVIDQPERIQVKVIPARYEMVDEQVLVKEESVRYDVIPATYKTVTERVMIEPERTETRVMPASMETYEERVLVRPAYTTWKPGAGVYGRSAGSAGNPAGSDVTTGELLCKVEVPAEYKTVTRTRVAKPESSQTLIIPAKFDTVTKQVVDQPARSVERKIPAEYRTVKVRKMVEAAKEERIVIPATYRTVQKRQVSAPARVEWREVLCDTNTSPAKIREVQTALSSKGFAVPATGTFGPQTLAAMESFQRSNGLPIGYLTIDTLKALGVSR